MSNQKTLAELGVNQTHAEHFNPAGYCVRETLRDDGAILIRAIRPEDKDRLREHAHGLSRESVYHRFFGYKRDLTDRDLQQFTELDFDESIGLAAILIENGHEKIAGVGRYIRISGERAELAFTVVDNHQGRGIGTLLLAHLSRIAKSNGITEFAGNTMGDNIHMLDVIAASGFKMQKIYDSGVVALLLRIDDAEDK
jgi:GNAT superfamily N-acetyltransferase